MLDAPLDAQTPSVPEDRVFFGGPAFDPTTDDPKATEAESALIARFEKQVEFPDFAKSDYARFDEDRKYVHTECMASDDEDTVVTNYILRFQHVLISQIYARDPSVSVKPKPQIGEYQDGLIQFGDTIEVVAKRLADEAGFQDTLTGMLQDVQTCGIAWLKLNVQQDFSRDPLGVRRQNDQLDNIARLRTLTAMYEEGNLQEGSAEAQELADVTDTVRHYMRGQIEQDIKMKPPAMQPQGVDPMGQMVMGPDLSDPRFGQLDMLEQQGAMLPQGILPEVPYFLGFNLDMVMPEDIRFDWNITRPEDFYFAKWVAHRVFMSQRDIADKWGDKLAKEDWEGTKAYKYGKDTTVPQISDDPADRTDAEVTNINNMCAVWELHDRAAGRIYTWVHGMKKFVSNVVATTTWHKFFPFFPLMFNRVTGKFIPISDVRLQMPLQDEINQKRTHEREAQKACYPRLIITAGLLTAAEKSKLENALPYAVIEVQKADEVATHLHELTVGSFDPKLYDTERAVRELEIVAGISQSASGTPGGSDSATEAAIANEQMGVQSDRRKTVVEFFIREVYSALIEIALQIFPEANIKEIAGPDAVWPVLDRERLWRGLNMEITGGSSGKPDKKKELELWTQFMQLAMSCGVVPNGTEVFKRILEVMELPVDMKRFTIDPKLIAAAQAAGMPVPGMPAPAPAPGGNSPNSSGKSPGAPPMSSRSGPPSPGGIQNGPSGAKDMKPKPQGGAQR